MKSVIRKEAVEEKKQVVQKAGKDPVDFLGMVKEGVHHDLVFVILIIRSYQKRIESYAIISKPVLTNLIVYSSIRKDREKKNGRKVTVMLQKCVGLR